MSIRVLIADDHALMRDGLKAMLQAARDITIVAEVADGREAVRCAAELRPDVAIMDISMPNLNGIDALGPMLRSSPQTRVIILSMHSDTEYVHRALAAGAAGYLLKEAAGTEVITALRAVHAGGRYLSPAVNFHRHPAAESATPIESLSARERQVLQLVVEGKTSAEIAAVIHLSPKSVETYRSRLMKKLGIDDIPALVKFAVRHGITTPD